MGKRFLVFSLLLLAPLAFGAEKRDNAKPAATHHSAQKKTPAGKRAVSSDRGKGHARHVAKGKKGSAQESDRARISCGFLKGYEFYLRCGQALGLQQQIA